MYQPRNQEKVLRLMEGAYDLHTHTSPDFFPRALDDFELLRQADQYGMAGVMLKKSSGSNSRQSNSGEFSGL